MDSAKFDNQEVELTYDELWHAIERSKSLYKKTRDPLVNSGIKLLAAALARELEEGKPILLTDLEQVALSNLNACLEAQSILTWE